MMAVVVVAGMGGCGPPSPPGSDPVESSSPEPAAGSTAPSEQELIRSALALRIGIPQEELVVSVAESTGRIARGTVSRAGEEDGGAFFAAKDTRGVWVVTYDGQDVPDCDEVDPYGYPTSWVGACMEEGVVVRRGG